jgi:hypothetical protein
MIRLLQAPVRMKELRPMKRWRCRSQAVLAMPM